MKYWILLLVGILISNSIFSQVESLNQKSNREMDSVKGNWGLSFVAFSNYSKNNFNEFSVVLGDYNTDLMNELFVTYNWGVESSYKKVSIGLNYGFGDVINGKNDSLNLSFSSHVFRFNFGYRLIERKNIILTPMLSLKMNRYNLVNSKKDENVSIEEYLNNRDLDIRLKQMTGFIGLNTSFKFNNNYLNIIPVKWWTLGLYGGYQFKLNKYPWISSSGNDIKSEHQIKVSNLNLGVILTLRIL